ncbi:MAG: hypothetical protein MH252_02745 [Thermosynechococcaceae cyanobacterium MS004]|nr:hypothetical protein [Thermosynechococcaceae cyanobacterium MS004]
MDLGCICDGLNGLGLGLSALVRQLPKLTHGLRYAGLARWLLSALKMDER